MTDHQEPRTSSISRRAVLGTAAAIVATPAMAEVCMIGPPKHEKGPLVWMDMDQVELDAAYDQNVYAPMIDQIQKRYATSSVTTRARLGAPKRFAYGPTAVEGLDLYPAKTATRRFSFSCTVAAGCAASPKIMPFPQICSSMPA